MNNGKDSEMLVTAITGFYLEGQVDNYKEYSRREVIALEYLFTKIKLDPVFSELLFDDFEIRRHCGRRDYVESITGAKLIFLSFSFRIRGLSSLIREVKSVYIILGELPGDKRKEIFVKAVSKPIGSFKSSYQLGVELEDWYFLKE